MNSESVSIIAIEPFIQKFVFTIIKTIQSHHLQYEEKQVIHADLVPRVSEKVMQASLRGKIIPPRHFPSLETVQKPNYITRKDMSNLVAPFRKPRQIIQRVRPVQQTPLPPPISPPLTNKPIDVPNAPANIKLSQDYGKITPLLNDPSVSSIECSGMGKPLMIIRAGQRQMTKIILSAREIKEILQEISDAVHIPLLEGVFRAAVDNFSISAVISEMIGSRFIIKKQTPYDLLKR